MNAAAGRFQVAPTGSFFMKSKTLFTVLDTNNHQPSGFGVFDTEHEAQTKADEANTALAHNERTS